MKTEIYTPEEARARAADMAAWYKKTGFEGYKHEAEKWSEIAEKAKREKV